MVTKKLEAMRERRVWWPQRRKRWSPAGVQDGVEHDHLRGCSAQMCVPHGVFVTRAIFPTEDTGLGIPRPEDPPEDFWAGPGRMRRTGDVVLEVGRRGFPSPLFSITKPSVMPGKRANRSPGSRPRRRLSRAAPAIRHGS